MLENRPNTDYVPINFQVSHGFSAALPLEYSYLFTAIEQAGDSIVITDLNGAIRYVNPAFEQITGYRRDEALGQTPALLKSGHHDAAFYRELWETIMAGNVWRGQIINRKKDGSLYIENATITPVYNAMQEIESFVAVKRDVTRELHLEEQIRQSQKMDAIGRLASGIAHDFNNLLTVILGHVDLLLAADHTPSDTWLRDMTAIRRASERAALLTRQMLTFSRKQALHPQVLELNTLIRDFSFMLSRTIGEQIEIVMELEPDLALIEADRGQIEQVLINLAINARDAMPSGGRLILRTANLLLKHAHVSRWAHIQPGWYVCLTVQDSGVGMNATVLDRLFEPFFTTKPSGQGTGLGLATVHGIVQQSNAAIEVHSTPGCGSIFTIYFPVSLAHQQDGTSHGTELSAGGTETLLVVEDEQLVRLLICQALRQLGYTVLEAPGGAEALACAADYAGEIHLLLTDWVMPGMSGMDLARRLGRVRPDIRVVFMSGYADELLWRQHEHQLNADFLQKPFELTLLNQRIRACLDAPHRSGGLNHENER